MTPYANIRTGNTITSNYSGYFMEVLPGNGNMITVFDSSTFGLYGNPNARMVIYNGTMNDLQVNLLEPLPFIPPLYSNNYGMYALKKMSIHYTGPIIKVRKSSDTTGVDATDFYIDPTGRQITNNNGMTLTSWLDYDTAYINKWYDQSMFGNYAIQDTIELQPIIRQNTSTKMIFNTEIINSYDINIPEVVLINKNNNDTYIAYSQFIIKIDSQNNQTIF